MFYCNGAARVYPQLIFLYILYPLPPQPALQMHADQRLVLLRAVAAFLIIGLPQRPRPVQARRGAAAPAAALPAAAPVTGHHHPASFIHPRAPPGTAARPGVIGGEALILPLMVLLLYVGYEAGQLSAMAQAEQRRRRRRAGPPYRVEHGNE